MIATAGMARPTHSLEEFKTRRFVAGDLPGNMIV